MNKLRGGFCDVDVVLKWLCLAVFGAIVVMAISTSVLTLTRGTGAMLRRNDKRWRVVDVMFVIKCPDLHSTVGCVA